MRIDGLTVRATLTGALIVLTVSVLNCSGDIAPLAPPWQTEPGGAFEACTDYRSCCPPELLKCSGDPDRGVHCTCPGLWDCQKNTQKCRTDLPKPSGSGWNCAWSSKAYTCKKKGNKSDVPQGGGQFNCNYSQQEFAWICASKYPPNPSNKPEGAGVWKCMTTGEMNKLYCEPGGKAPPPPKVPPGTTTPPPPTNPPPTNPPGNGTWNCKNLNGEYTCRNGDLPPGGGDWRCHEKTDLIIFKAWVCTGTTNKGAPPPGGGKWKCVKIGGDSSKDEYRCERPKGPEDTPPGGGHFACAKGSEFNGTVCVKVPTPPVPPGLYPKPGDKCVPGTMRWCDGLQYCGWGQATCLPNGTWPTTKVDGKVMLDCQELPDGRRPNTKCACYHFYFNGDCCERPDCMIPKGSKGQICAKSKGKLCDYCNPDKPECSETGGLCMLNNKSGEAYCGRQCSKNQPCPFGYNCVGMKTKAGTSYQCRPADNSCYY